MNKRSALGLAALLLATGVSDAANPVLGWYGGISLGASHSSDVDFFFTHPTTGASTKGSMSYGYGVDFSGDVGYRFKSFRVEGELLFNTSPYRDLTLGSVTISNSTLDPLNLKGQTNTLAIMANAFIECSNFTGEDSSWSPFIGAGVGYAEVKNTIKFNSYQTYISGTKVSHETSTPAGQVLLGLNYFLDDFTTLGLDFRYFVTKKVYPIDSRFQFAAINIVFNGSFDCA